MAFDVSLPASVIVTPPGGAAVLRLTGNDAAWPGPVVTLEGNMITPELGGALVNVKLAGAATPDTEAVTK